MTGCYGSRPRGSDSVWKERHYIHAFSLSLGDHSDHGDHGDHGDCGDQGDQGDQGDCGQLHADQLLPLVL
mgnify:FL=1